MRMNMFVEAIRGAIASVDAHAAARALLHVQACTWNVRLVEAKRYKRQQRQLAKQARQCIGKAVVKVALEQSLVVAMLFTLSPNTTERLMMRLVQSPVQYHDHIITEAIAALELDFVTL